MPKFMTNTWQQALYCSISAFIGAVCAVTINGAVHGERIKRNEEDINKIDTKIVTGFARMEIDLTSVKGDVEFIRGWIERDERMATALGAIE